MSRRKTFLTYKNQIYYHFHPNLGSQPWSHEFYNFIRGSDIHNHEIILPSWCPEVNKFFWEIIHDHLCSTLGFNHWTLSPGVMSFTILVEGPLLLCFFFYNHANNFTAWYPGVKKKVWFSSHTLCPSELGSMKFTNFVPIYP